MTIVLAEDDSQAMRAICPPCTGNCDQGRNCPLRLSEQDGDALDVFRGLLWAFAITVGAVASVSLLAWMVP